jgi:glycosyltransferase involved in cell wall biosynthesis
MAEFNLVKAQICQENGEVEKYFQCVKNTFTVEELGNDCFSSTDDEKRLLVNSLTSTNLTTKSNGPLVSVVMTVYKDNEMLDSAINSVLEQSHENLELIIVDDSSPDNVMSYLANKAKKDNRIKLVKMEKNGGTYLAKNQGMSISKGKYIAFHDSDDWLHPRKIEACISHLENDPNLVAVFSNYFRVDENGTIIFKGNGAIRPACISLTMRREEILNDLGYFDSVRVSADSEYEYRMKSVYGAERIKYLSTPYLIASVRSESLSQGGRFAVGWSGLSGVRLLYRQSYTAWHQSEQFKEDCMIEKNQSKKRKFPAPKEIY